MHDNGDRADGSPSSRAGKGQVNMSANEKFNNAPHVCPRSPRGAQFIASNFACHKTELILSRAGGGVVPTISQIAWSSK